MKTRRHLFIALSLALTACASDEMLFAQYDQLCRSDVCMATPAEVRYEIDTDSVPWEPAVYFGYDRDDLSDGEQQRLERNVAVLRAHPDLRVNLQAFTDSTASDTYNLELSDRRRQAVETHLVTAGIDASRIVSSIAGEMLPIHDGDSVIEKAINRRVELMLIDSSGAPLSFRVQIPDEPAAPDADTFVPPYPDRKVIDDQGQQGQF